LKGEEKRHVDEEGDVIKSAIFWDFTERRMVARVKWVPVNTAWRVLGLRMEERPPVMEGRCEYIE
jgi:hypothetical protein